MSAGATAPAARWPRFALLVPAIATLVFATLAGLVRAGWVEVPTRPGAVAFHGGLMVSGFFGTLIALERAVALGRAWAFASPALSAAGALALLAGANFGLGAGLIAAGGLVFVGASVQVCLRQPALFTATLLAGAFARSLGDALWLAGRPVHGLVAFWMLFLVLTIAGERLELGRLVQPPPGARRLFPLLAGALLLAGLVAAFDADVGARLLGVTLVAMALWLARWDVARRTVRQRGLPHFVAICLYAAYLWLAVAGVLLVSGGAPVAGLHADAVLHAVFLGFAFSMVFGHAPIIFPALLRVAVPFRSWFYLPLVVLHGSVAARVAADLLGSFEGRRVGSLGNALALGLFLASVVAAVISGWRRVAGTPRRAGLNPIAPQV